MICLTVLSNSIINSYLLINSKSYFEMSRDALIRKIYVMSTIYRSTKIMYTIGKIQTIS